MKINYEILHFVKILCHQAGVAGEQCTTKKKIFTVPTVNVKMTAGREILRVGLAVPKIGTKKLITCHVPTIKRGGGARKN